MTAEPLEPTDVQVDELTAAVEAMVRRRTDLTPAEQDDLFRALCIPCPGKPYGCGVPAAEECVSLHDGGPLGRQVAHFWRLANAGREWEPCTEQELKGLPRRRSEAGRAEAVNRESGRDLPGYQDGKSWDRPSAREDQGWR